MKKALKHIEGMDFSTCWLDWRKGLKQSIEHSRTYYLDETVRVLVEKLDDFLSKKTCKESKEEEVINAMWEVATQDERRTLALLFLKIANRL
ncbi:DUF3243 family protein [Chloroflexota bacterium]